MNRALVRYILAMATELTGGFPPSIGQPALRALTGAGYSDYRELSGVSRKSLAALHGVGPKALRIIEELLAQEGESLG